MPWWLALLIGVGAGIAGLLPWLISGGALPLQNLWEGGVPEPAPFVLLPFSQYYVQSVFALLVMGAVFGGIVARVLRRRGSGTATVWLIAAGVTVVGVVAVAQTSITVAGGLQDRPESPLYLAGMTVGSAVSVLVGLGVLWLIGSAPRAGALVGLAVGALISGLWLSAGTIAWGHSATIPELLTYVWRFAPAACVGVAIAWAGANTAGRIVASVAAIGMLMLSIPTQIAVGQALGTRAIFGDVREMVDAGIQTFASVLGHPDVYIVPVVVALVVAIVGLITARAINASRSRAALPQEHAGNN